MAAPTTEQLVAMLTAGGQAPTAQWLAANPQQRISGTGVWGTPTTNTSVSGNANVEALFRDAGVASPYGGGGRAAPGVIGGSTVDPNGATTTPLVPGGLNVPFGSDYFAPSLDSWTRLQLANMQNQQFQQTARQAAAEALARLYANGPASAAELAFLNAGQGFPAIGGSASAIADLIRSSTFGASNPDATLAFGNGQSVSIPSTLGGQALARLQADPNLAGVIESFAKAAGNPDILTRSARAALPAGFSKPRYGNPVLPGLGL